MASQVLQRVDVAGRSSADLPFCPPLRGTINVTQRNELSLLSPMIEYSFHFMQKNAFLNVVSTSFLNNVLFFHYMIQDVAVTVFGKAVSTLSNKIVRPGNIEDKQ